MKVRTIGFCGLAGAGKSTAALRFVKTFGAVRVRFAEPLKAMLIALGLDWEQVDGSAKAAPCALLCGKTPRQAMQTLGTEWGRDLVGGDLWLNAWKAQLCRLPGDTLIVADDVRFDNEAEAIRARDGLIVEVKRPSLDMNEGHAHVSERHGFAADFAIFNEGCLADFEGAVTAFGETVLNVPLRSETCVLNQEPAVMHR